MGFFAYGLPILTTASSLFKEHTGGIPSWISSRNSVPSYLDLFDRRHPIDDVIILFLASSLFAMDWSRALSKDFIELCKSAKK